MINPFFRDIAARLLESLLKDPMMKDKDQDMIFRTVINRLYYSAFHNIMSFFRFQFTRLEERAIHDAIQEKLIIHDRDAIANLLEEMRLLRVDADYRLTVQATRSRCERMKAYHESIIELLATNASG